VADLFAAARVLHAAGPWNHVDDDQTLRMDIPALGVEAACVSIIGALGQNRGLVIFPSQTAFDAFVDAAEAGPPSDGLFDFGTTTLSLTFERADELPASMRREALEHGWPVAGSDAYPRVEHRDRDAVPRPLTERDVRIATACALAVAAFTTSQGRLFSTDDFEPVSVTYTGDDEVAVRLTAPYDAVDLFEPEPAGFPDEDDGPDRLGPAPATAAPAPIHTVDERLVRRMARFAGARFEDWLDQATRPFADPEAAVQLFLPWAVYHLPVDGRPVVEWFLAEEGRRLSPEERSWLEAQRSTWLGVWEVLEVDAGRGLEVRDLLTGVERRVAEVSGSRILVARDAVLGRVVDHGGISVFAGIHPRPLAPEDAAEVVGTVRKRVRRRHAIPVERLREPAVERFLIARWEDGVAAMDARRRLPPQLRNTDGDELLFTTDHFAFDPASRGEVEAILASLDGLEGPDAEGGETCYTFVRAERGTAGMPGNTMLGLVRLAAAGLKLETNSLARADRLRERLEQACGGVIAHRAREHTSLDALAASAPRAVEEPEEPPPEVQRALAEWIEQYYAEWMDHGVPALGGMTPRQAARTREGRERLELLLKDMENRAARAPHGGQPDVGRLRAELGMED
jgi:hypothetical protein